MSSGSVCRVCLEGNMKLAPTESIPLLNLYERITNSQFKKDERPSVFCPFCYQRLLKCYTFFTMAWRAENLFDQMILQGVKEFVTKLKLGVMQHMTIAPIQYVTMVSSAAYGTQTIKEEPKAVVKEENVIIVKSEAVCRVCLAGNLKLNPMESIQLQDIYYKITNIQFNSDDGRPRAVCPFCYRKLLKCYTFSKIACRSEKLFDQLLLNGLKELTDELVTKLTLRVKQPMAVTNLQPVNIEPTFLPLMVTVKKEPTPVQEEYTEENQTGNSGALILKECTRRGLKKQKPLAIFFCTICGKKFDCKTIFKRHMKIHTENKQKYVCNVCNKELKHKQSLAMHMRCHSDNKQFTCTICNKQFRHMHHLLPHMRTHTGEKPYPCTVCQKRFNEKSHLNRHMVLHTGGSEHTIRRYSCKECNKRFPTTQNLNKHMLVHTGEKPYSCSECNKCYQTKHSLDLHMKVHTKDIPPLACHLCDKRYHYISHLRVHIKNHSKIKKDTIMNELTSFQCVVCKESCTRKKNLLTHMRLLHPGHRLFACNDCDKQYDKKSHLIRHMSIHQGKKYSCEVCDKKIIHKHNIETHMRIHTGETPYYACKLCDKKFTRRYILSRHINKKHKVKSESESDSE